MKKLEFKEFWLTWFPSGRGQIHSFYTDIETEFFSFEDWSKSTKPKDVTHVIEYAALAAKDAEIKRLEAENEKVRNAYADLIETHEINKIEITKLREQLRIAKAADNERVEK